VIVPLPAVSTPEPAATAPQKKPVAVPPSSVTAGTTTHLLSMPVAVTAGRTYSMYLVGTQGQYAAILTRDD